MSDYDYNMYICTSIFVHVKTMDQYYPQNAQTTVSLLPWGCSKPPETNAQSQSHASRNPVNCSPSWDFHMPTYSSSVEPTISYRFSPIHLKCQLFGEKHYQASCVLCLYQKNGYSDIYVWATICRLYIPVPESLGLIGPGLQLHAFDMPALLVQLLTSWPQKLRVDVGYWI